MGDLKITGWAVVAGALCVLLWVAIIFMWGSAFGEFGTARAVYREAVEHGHAEWVVDTDGDTTFRWLGPGDVAVDGMKEVE